MIKNRFFKRNKLTLLILASLTLGACSNPHEISQGDESQPVNNMDYNANSITENEIIAAQEAWAAGILSISEAYLNNEDYRAVAQEVLDTLYGYQDGIVLFKPTKASEVPFRFTEEGALSYFVTGSIAEDEGFAINPWVEVRFDETRGIILNGNTALAMGTYYFTAPESNEEIAVEYTFGYYRDNQGNLRIQLHHSSVPY